MERFVLTQFSPVHKLKLTVDAPVTMPFRYRVEGMDLKPVRTEADGRFRLVFEAGPLRAWSPVESFMPPDMPRISHILFSTAKSWSDVATAYAATVDARIDVPSLKPIAAQVLGEETDRDKAVAKLTNYVRKLVRYTGIEFGDAEVVPHTPQETLTRHYGDCKDQAALLVAMLRAAGYHADVALLQSGFGADVAADMPGLGAFNHAIVYVAGKPSLWIDPTFRYGPPLDLPLSDQGRWALVVDPLTRKLVHTRRRIIARTAVIDTLNMTWRKEMVGTPGNRLAAAVRVRRDCGIRYALMSREDVANWWKKYMKEKYHSARLTSFHLSSSQDLSKPFSLSAEVADAQVGGVDDTEAVAILRPSEFFKCLPSLLWKTELEDKESPSRWEEPPLSQRQTPLVLPEPQICEWQFSIVPPPGYVPRPLPDDVSKHYGPVTFDSIYERKGDAVVVTFRLDTGPGVLTAEEAKALQRGIAELGAQGDLSEWKVTVTFDNAVARHLAAGRFKEGLAICRRAVEQHPDQASQHWCYAHVLQKAGQGEAARQEAPRGRAGAEVGRRIRRPGAGAHPQPARRALSTRHGLERRRRGLPQVSRTQSLGLGDAGRLRHSPRTQ